MPKFRLLLLAIVILCFSAFPALASDCTAPVLHYRISSDAPGSYFGISLAAIGDIDGDGKTDFIVGAPYANPDGIIEAGSAYVYSGADGTLLRQIKGVSKADYFGRSISGIGDVNGDGRPDFLVGSPKGYARAYSGAGDSLLYEISFPGIWADFWHFALAGIGDIDGDNKPDFIIGLPLNSPNNIAWAGSAFIYSGSDGASLCQIDGTGDGDLLGFSVAGMGDITGDQKADFLVGVMRGDTSFLGHYWNGSANVYSGSDRSLLQQEFGDKLHDFFGWSVAAVGDLDGDGKGDVIAGAPYESGGPEPVRPSYGKVFSSISGDVLFEISGEPTSRLGLSVKGLSDVNGDGTPDFMVGAPGGFSYFPEQATPTGAAYVYSGIDGSLIFSTRSSVLWDHFGWSVTGTGDLNDDGKEDIIIGAPFSSYPNRDTGVVYVFASKTVPKGDLNFDSTLTIADITNLLNVVFIDQSLALSPCTADLNCDGAFSPGDIVLLLNRVFLQTALPCQ